MSQTQVQSGFIGDNAVTAAQIANNAVGSAEIVDGSVGSAEIVDGSVGSAEIANGAVTIAKLDSTVSGALVPIGAIIMWSGSIATIPSNWRLCNGEYGTPNLRDRFIVGAGSGYAVAATGGSKDAIVVSHTHTITDPGHKHGISGSQGTPGGGLEASSGNATYPNTTNTSIQTTGISIDYIGSSATNANLPPYYALAFIMRTS